VSSREAGRRRASRGPGEVILRIPQVPFAVPQYSGSINGQIALKSTHLRVQRFGMELATVLAAGRDWKAHRCQRHKGGVTVENRIKHVVGVVVGLAVALMLLSSPVGAVTLGADLDGITLGAAITPALTNQIVSSIPVFEDHGTLTTQVYSNGSLYTYLAVLQPKVTGISMFSTAFAVAGLTGSMGWSFGQAALQGADAVWPGIVDRTNVFTPSIDGNIVKFTVNFFANANCSTSTPASCFWNRPDPAKPGYFLPITFFFQSTLSPGTSPYTDAYSMTNSFTGSGVGYAPDVNAVPEPTSLLLLLSGVAGVGLWRGLRRQSA